MSRSESWYIRRLPMRGLAVLRARLREARWRSCPAGSVTLALLDAAPSPSSTVEVRDRDVGGQLGAGPDRLADQRLAAGLDAGRACRARRAARPPDPGGDAARREHGAAAPPAATLAATRRRRRAAAEQTPAERADADRRDRARAAASAVAFSPSRNSRQAEQPS